MAKATLNWPRDRWEELCDLENLLIDVAALNRANMHLERTAKCIELAEKLSNTNRGGDEWRASFVQFLRDLAISRTEAT